MDALRSMKWAVARTGIGRSFLGLGLPPEQASDDGAKELAKAILEPTFRSRF